MPCWRRSGTCLANLDHRTCRVRNVSAAARASSRMPSPLATSLSFTLSGRATWMDCSERAGRDRGRDMPWRMRHRRSPRQWRLAARAAPWSADCALVRPFTARRCHGHLRCKDDSRQASRVRARGGLCRAEQLPHIGVLRDVVSTARCKAAGRGVPRLRTANCRLRLRGGAGA